MSDAQEPTTGEPRVSGDEFKGAVGHFASGVVVLTVRDVADEDLGTRDDVGMTATAFTSVSMDPPLVLVGVGAESYLAEVLERQHRWAVTVLSHGQKAIAGRFAMAGRPSVRILLGGVDHHRGVHTDAMIVDGGLAALECRTQQLVPAGDHVLVVGEVLAVDYVAGGTAAESEGESAGGAPARAGGGDAGKRHPERSALVHFGGSYYRLDP